MGTVKEELENCSFTLTDELEEKQKLKNEQEQIHQRREYLSSQRDSIDNELKAEIRK
jgi:hypothetical protein